MPEERRDWHGSHHHPVWRGQPGDARRGRLSLEDLVGLARRLGRHPSPLRRCGPDGLQTDIIDVPGVSNPALRASADADVRAVLPQDRLWMNVLVLILAFSFLRHRPPLRFRFAETRCACHYSLVPSTDRSVRHCTIPASPAFVYHHPSPCFPFGSSLLRTNRHDKLCLYPLTHVAKMYHYVICLFTQFLPCVLSCLSPRRASTSRVLSLSIR